jgi:ribosomal protein S18 acetylase RimI-like enzyme
LDEVADLIRDAYQQYQGSFPTPAWKLYLEDITDVRSRLNESELIVAEARSRLVGTVTLYLKSTSWPQDWAGIRLLAVLPAFRGHGIGQALMDECIRRCREQSVITIGLHTTHFMDVARRMYERMGFRRAPELDFHPASGAVVMAYRLDLLEPYSA